MSYRPRLEPEYSNVIDIIKSIGSEEAKRRLGLLEYAPSKKYQRWLILPDVHRPFHNKILWHKILKLINDINHSLYGIVITGDYLDLFTLGSYNADSVGLLKDITLEDEYNDGRKGIYEIEQAVRPGTKKVYLYGNHEDRYNRELMKGDRAKYGGSLISPREALHLDKLKYEVLTHWMEDTYKLGSHLEVAHGIFTNVHTAKKHLEEFQTSVIFGHTHRISSFGAGKHIAYNIGWLGDLEQPQFRYMYKKARVNKWMNGFAEVNIDDNGYFWVQPIQCFDNKFIYNGRYY